MTKRIAREAEKSPERMRHVFALIRGGAIVAIGVNHGERHAEVVALGKLWPSKRRGCRFVSLRVRRDGSLGMARPCARCEEVLLDNGIARGLYSTADGRMESWIT
jgi:pyrimidine deaminase RibD-like protein